MSSSLAGNNPRVNSMFSQMMEITKDPEFKNASPDVQQMLLFGGVLGSQPSQIPTQEELDRMGGFQQQQARAAQELGKESVEKAYQFSTLAKLPKQISEGFGNQAMLTVLGARSAVDAMNQTLDSYPQMSFAMTPFRAEKYLGQNRVTYSFPAGLKTFDSSKAFSGGYGDFSSASSSKSGGGMDPLSAGLGLASAGLGFISGIGQQRTAASIAQAQLAAQNAAFLEGRELNKGQLAGSLFNKLFDVGSGGDIAFGREKAGKEFLTGPYAERLMGLGSEEAKRARLAAISPESKERAQFENRLAIDREIAARRAQTDAMFGPISSSYRA